MDNLLKDYIGTHYQYDARGNMVKRIHNGQTTTFVWVSCPDSVCTSYSSN